MKCVDCENSRYCIDIKEDAIGCTFGIPKHLP